jgi:hypothetical protein
VQVAIHDCDVCLITWEQIMKELREHHASSVLAKWGFWRIIIDEAQTLEINYGEDGDMLNDLWRRKMWLLSGTTNIDIFSSMQPCQCSDWLLHAWCRHARAEDFRLVAAVPEDPDVRALLPQHVLEVALLPALDHYGGHGAQHGKVRTQLWWMHGRQHVPCCLPVAHSHLVTLAAFGPGCSPRSRLAGRC